MHGAAITTGNLMEPQSKPGGRKDSRTGGNVIVFPVAIRIRASGCRAVVCTVGEALEMIDKELPAELHRLRRWTFARALLEEASLTRRKKDLAAAVRQFKQALSNEAWLVEDEKATG
jgi:hypothetical protein